MSDIEEKVEERSGRFRPHVYETFMNIAREFERRSTCLRNQFGAIIVTHDFTQIVAIGYNGAYKGGPNHCISLQQGKCGCVHSEENCIIKFPYGMHKNTIMFVTGNPCIKCATLIINAGIDKVIYEREYTSDNFEGLKLLEKAGINVQQINEVDDFYRS